MECDLFDPRKETWYNAEICHREVMHHPRKGGSSNFVGELSVSQFRLRFASMQEGENQSVVFKRGFLMLFEIPITSIYRVTLINRKKRQKKEVSASDNWRNLEDSEFSSIIVYSSDSMILKFSTFTEDKNFPSEFLEHVLNFGVRRNYKALFGMHLGDRKLKNLQLVHEDRVQDDVWLTDFDGESFTSHQKEGIQAAKGEPHRLITFNKKAFEDDRTPRISFMLTKNFPSILLRCGKMMKGQKHTIEVEFRAACKNCAFVLNGGSWFNDSEQHVRVVKLKKLLPRLEEVQQARRSLRDLCQGYEPDASNGAWLAQLDATQWLSIVSRTLKTASTIAWQLRRDLGSAQMLSEGTDSDWNCVICSLVNIMLFPRLRSIEGMKEVIVREWCAARHPFAFRQELAQDPTGLERPGPLFPLFLDCVQQLWTQFPHCFTFSPDFLIVLYDLSYAGLFREFLVHLDSKAGALPPSVFNLQALLSPDGLELMKNPVFDLAVEMWRSQHAPEPEHSTEVLLEVVAADSRALAPDVEVRFMRLWRENYLRALSFLDIGQVGRAAELWRYREILHLVRSQGQQRISTGGAALGMLAPEEAADVAVHLRIDASTFRLPSGLDQCAVTSFFPFSKENSGGSIRTSCYPRRVASHFDLADDTTL